MRGFVLGCLLASVLLLIACDDTGQACFDRPVDRINVPVHGQEETMWCWAACGAMSMEVEGPPVAQCDEANKLFKRTDCCSKPRVACNQGGWPPFEAYNFLYRTSSRPLDFLELRTELACNRQPVIFQWIWPGGGSSHVMVASGFDVGGGNLIFYNDPSPLGTGNYAITTYSNYVATPGHHTHGLDYYGIRPRREAP